MFAFEFGNHAGSAGTGSAGTCRRDANVYAFYLQFTECGARPRLDLPARVRSAPPGLARAMLDWLTKNCDLFGLPAQNWMLVVVGGLLLYIGVLALPRRRRRNTR